MEITLFVSHSYYDTFYNPTTVRDWQRFWDRLLRMAYLREGIVERYEVVPSQDDDGAYYARKTPKNYEEITFEYAWRHFCKTYKGDLCVVPELKEIYVPESLLDCPGVWSLFRHSFPNCRIVFWN
jgi:hypothetical protein